MVLGAPNANGDALEPELLLAPSPLPNPLGPDAVLLPNTLVDCPPVVFPNPLDDPAPTFPNPLDAGAAAGLASPPKENMLPAGFALDAPLGFAFPELNENPLAAGFGAGAPNGEELAAVVVEGAADGAAAGVGASENPPMGFVAAGLGTAGVAPKGKGAADTPPKGVEPKGVLAGAGSAGLTVFDGAENANGEGLFAAVEAGAPKAKALAGAAGTAAILGALKVGAMGVGAGEGLGFIPNPDAPVADWGANSEGAAVVAVVAVGAGAGVAENKGLGASSFFAAANENKFAGAGAAAGVGAGAGSAGLGA